MKTTNEQGMSNVIINLPFHLASTAIHRQWAVVRGSWHSGRNNQYWHKILWLVNLRCSWQMEAWTLSYTYSYTTPLPTFNSLYSSPSKVKAEAIQDFFCDQPSCPLLPQKKIQYLLVTGNNPFYHIEELWSQLANGVRIKFRSVLCL